MNTTPSRSSLLSPPNILTLIRVGMIPALIVACYVPHEHANVWAAGIFILASITDWLDGYLARKLELSSNFGAFLDPVADKLIVATALILLVKDHPTIVISLSTIIIISREITISALREWLAELHKRNIVAVSWVGKWKTTMQMIAIALMLYADPIVGLPTFLIGEIFLVIAALLTIWSMCLYLKAAWPTLRDAD